MSLESINTIQLFAYPSRLSFETGNESLDKKINDQFTRQIKAFFHHCQLFGEIATPSETQNYSGYLLNLEKKNVTWEEPDDVEHTVVALEMRIYTVTFSPPYYSENQYFSFFFKNRGHSYVESYHLKEKRIPSKHLPISYMAGNEIDIVKNVKSEKIDPSFWDTWKLHDLKAAKTYRQTIYPLFQWAVHTAFDVLKHPLHIADIAGGDGELSLILADNGFVERIILVENNSESVELATTRINCTCSFHSQESKEKITIQNADIIDCDFSTTFNEPMDMIILSGVVAQQVLCLKESKNLLMRCKTFLAHDGYIVIASHSNKYFSKNDYEAMGFLVLNSTVNIGEVLKPELESFYVLKINSSEIIPQ